MRLQWVAEFYFFLANYKKKLRAPMSDLTVLLYVLPRYSHPELNGVCNFGTVVGCDQRLKNFAA
jgi:hypothetical protein